MKKILLIVLPVLTALFSGGQANVLDASTIPAALKENAHSVKREEDIRFEVRDIDAARLNVHEVYTVLDAEGKDVLDFVEASTSFEKLEDAEIHVYDATGKSINRYKLKEMRSETFDEGLVDDGKFYYFRVTAPSYPITVQYDYSIKFKGTLNYPDYQIQDPEQSVEHSTFTASVPADIDLRFKPKNITLQPDSGKSGQDRTYKWEVRNLAAIPREEGTLKEGAVYPRVLVAPNRFSMDDYPGDLSSWNAFGYWYWNLAKEASNLPDDAKKRLQDMVAGARNDKEKIRILYHYLQQNFRYVSITLGIGGYKPFDAASVDSKKYGDCKALSNYMQACLSAVGINSYQALINAEYNSEPVDTSFPNNGFNHVILCVPLQGDTTWLECTSNTTDFGVLGNFTENKKALLITPAGGVLVSTPRSTPAENRFSCMTTVQLNEDGSGTSESMIRTSGEYKQQVLHYILNESKDDREKFLVSSMGFLQPYEFDFTRELKEDSCNMAFKLALEKIPEFTAGSKMFLNPRIYKIWAGSMPDDDHRKNAFYFECPFIKTDTTIYQLPDGYTVDNLPQPRDLTFDYGSYKTSYRYDPTANRVTTVASLLLTQSAIPPGKYQETRNFFGGVIEEYTEKLVIRKK